MSKISLIDLVPGQRYAEWWVIYYPRIPHFFWAKWLKQGFRHVELWRPYRFGKGAADVVWLRLTPTFEILESELDFDPRAPWVRVPGCTAQRVQVLSTAYKVRQWWMTGPPSCVETVKNALAIKAAFVRTPWQLYRYIKQRNGVIRA